MNEVLVARYLSGEADPSEIAALKNELEHAPEFAKELEILEAAWQVNGLKASHFDVARIRHELAVRIGMVPEKSGQTPPVPISAGVKVQNGTGASRGQWLGVGLVVAAACGILYMRATGVAPRSAPSTSDAPPVAASEQVAAAPKDSRPVAKQDASPSRSAKSAPRYESAQTSPPEVPVPGANWFELATMRRYGGAWTDNNIDRSQLQLAVPRISTQPRDELRGNLKEPRGQNLPSPRKRERKQGQSSS